MYTCMAVFMARVERAKDEEHMTTFECGPAVLEWIPGHILTMVLYVTSSYQRQAIP